MRRFLFLAASLLLLSGCALFESRADRVMRNSPDYRAGYSDGCASVDLKGANPRESGLMRDDAAYAANKAYRSGWGAGFGSCRGAAGGMGPSDRGPIADPTPGVPRL